LKDLKNIYNLAYSWWLVACGLLLIAKIIYCAGCSGALTCSGNISSNVLFLVLELSS
jgi:hypothetical protein